MWGWIKGGEQQEGSDVSQDQQENIKKGFVQETVVFDAPMEDIIAIICDYDSYEEFVPALTKSKITKVEKHDKQTGDHQKIVYYELDAKFKTVTYHLQLNYDTKQNTVTWKETGDGPFCSNVGGWSFKVLKKDSNGNAIQVQATYDVKIEFSVWVPGFVSQYLIGSSLPETLKRFKERIEARAKK